MSVRLLAVAVATLLLVACGSDPEAGSATQPSVPPSTATPTTQPAETTTTRGPAQTSTTTTTTMDPSTTAPVDTAEPESDLDAASRAFMQWVGYLAEGDHQNAWDAMAPTSQAAVGEGPFFDHLVYSMSEGWGSWAAGEDITFSLEEDQNGRTLLWLSGTIRPEGMVEDREVAVPMIEIDGGYLVSPFEEFGNVADAVEEELEGTAPPPVPADSGTGKRVVYSNSGQRVWLVDGDETVVDSYLVSGKQGVPEPGNYEVFSRSEVAFAGHDDITMRYMVRFAHGENLPIGFHSIPNDGNGAPLQSEEELGEYHSAGCVRQSLNHAAFLYDWAVEGTPVVVLA